MIHSVKTQMLWENFIHILRDYLLNTSIPLIFEELLVDPKIFNNKKWTELMDPQPTADNPEPTTYTRTWEHDSVWEFILKDTLLKVFRDRLLGSQQEFDVYVHRSEKYTELFNDMIGGQDCRTDLMAILRDFLDMVKDYLCRNLPGRKSVYENLTLCDVLDITKKAYQARSLCDNAKKDQVGTFYIDFWKQTLSSGLLLQFDEMAKDLEHHPKSKHFLVLVELFQILFIYVYMIDYIKYYPLCKDDAPRKLTGKEKAEQNLCLLSTLTNVDYKFFFDEAKKNRVNNRRYISPKNRNRNHSSA